MRIRTGNRNRPGLRHARIRGMTLIELMIVILIIGILAGVAIPSYRAYMVRSQRTDATAALLRLASAQEKFYLQNNRYADDDELDTAPPAGLGIDGTEHGWYTLSITDADASGWSAQAVAVSSGPQAADESCEVFTLNSRGVKGASDAVGGGGGSGGSGSGGGGGGGGGADTTDTCWR